MTTQPTQDSVQLPDLSAVIQWLEAGCDPAEAVKELKHYQARLVQARAALPAQLSRLQAEAKFHRDDANRLGGMLLDAQREIERLRAGGGEVTHVCPAKDIVCGDKPANWCATCPKKHVAPALTDAQIESVFERHKGTPGRELRVTIGRALLAEAAAPALVGLITECRDALAEELAAWDIDPPIHHVKQAHDKCEAWLAAHNIPAPGASK
jgi:hypothetical protein